MDNHSWIETALDELRTTLAGKNEDYRIGGEFSNFEYATEIAATTTTQVMLTQIGIKVGRLVGLSDSPNNESFKDSVKDLAGYAIILYGYLLQGGQLEEVSEAPGFEDDDDWESCDCGSCAPVVEHQVEEHAHTAVTSHAYEGDGGPCEAEAYGQPCGAPRRTHELDEWTDVGMTPSPHGNPDLCDCIMCASEEEPGDCE